MCVFLAVLGFHCCGQTSATVRGGYSLVMVHGLVTVATSLPQHQLQSMGNSAVALHRVSCLELCGVFLDQGSNLYPCHCRGILYSWTTRKSQCSRFLNWSGSVVLEGLKNKKQKHKD